ncbi:EAL domain-containing protein [Aquitalea palustris]|uniref:EAL domain-containing protein n=1 Tax=Aquitalea palustris TaxID=2480983 RepID=A0A454JFA9_9NEIS|nr:EAL domain-containing protein [Aquitalea palustris]RMC94244.1 EAL domain-containing protein [Aquitalea palustris]
MYSTRYLGRQPIVDANQQLVAYELLFRSSQANVARVDDDVMATTAVIRHAFVDLGVGEVLGDRLGFINVSETLLMDDLLDVLPCDKVVLEILETVKVTPPLLARLAELRHKGFRLAMDDVVELDADRLALLPLVDIVKIDLVALSLLQLRQLVAELASFPGILLAEKVDTVEQFELCRELGIQWFQGYFFARPTVLSTRQANASQHAMLSLLGLLMSDADNDELSQALKLAPDVVLMLMKLSSTASAATRRPVSSVSEAIMLLGRAKIKRWSMLLLFASNATDVQPQRNPLLELAATRGRIMELLAEACYPERRDVRESAFMIGMLSLVDVLVQQPKAEVIASLPIEDSLKEAVLEGRHVLGELLRVALSLEDDAVPHPAGYDPEVLMRVETQALDWVNSMWQ